MKEAAEMKEEGIATDCVPTISVTAGAIVA